MFKKLFGSKKNKPMEEEIYAPISGKVIAIEQVPDPTFSEKMMGDGIAIEPADGTVVSPMDGEVVQVFPTKHAVGLKGRSGLELLIHIGLETVSMNGEGFQAAVKAGDRVKKGQTLIRFDLDLVKQKAASSVIPLVVTNMNAVQTVEKTTDSTATAGETRLMAIKMKG
ncbi:PTS sugar transporter subunit IIA [Caenibacillus caldisaponilyticus]|uniref:PTS sugar transporter subunit IIA n=1 Tax=Caenibacillus caldisaponilyticus TaxID=1674942 RepID=UPI0009889350|nr:PTS glucose transporter subunit IIA [Caenibacillus caldisaponilyticus]